jgi:hypothetical protein
MGSYSELIHNNEGAVDNVKLSLLYEQHGKTFFHRDGFQWG